MKRDLKAADISPDSASDTCEDSSDDERLEYVTENCDQVRRKIRAFIENGEMKVGEFCRVIGVSNSSHNNFLRQNGPMKGSESNAYVNAHRFFKKRELKGIAPPRKKAKPSASKAANKAAEDKYDVSDIHLDEEEEKSGLVPIFETCNSMRTKINAHLRQSDVTQASLARELTKQHYEPGKKVTSNQIATFLGRKGPSGGCESIAFYTSYVYFEKLRIKTKKPKGKFRLEMEDEWQNVPYRLADEAVDGFSRKAARGGYLCTKGSIPYEDKYGRVRIESLC